MGKGKGEPEYWVAVVKPGTVMFELSGVSEQQAKVCFARLSAKMPVKVPFVRHVLLNEVGGTVFVLLNGDTMKVKDIREMSDEQLELTAKEAAETLFRLRISSSDRTHECAQPDSEESPVDRSSANDSE